MRQLLRLPPALAVTCAFLIVGGTVLATVLLAPSPQKTPAAAPGSPAERQEIHTWEIEPYETNEVSLVDVNVGTDGIQIFGQTTGGNSTTLFIEDVDWDDVTAPSITFGQSAATGSMTVNNLSISNLACEGYDVKTTDTPSASQVNIQAYDVGSGDSNTLEIANVTHVVIKGTGDGGKIRKLTFNRVHSRGPITFYNVAIGTGDFNQLQAGDGDGDLAAVDCAFGFTSGKILTGEGSAVTNATNAFLDYR